MAREGVILKCTETGQETYITKKNKKKNPEKLRIKKFNPQTRKHTIYVEKK